MEIGFENKTISTYREIYHQTKRTQESCESVVPDTDDDIGKLASVQTAVMLKSKEITANGVLISGEAWASLLYITEDQQKTAFVKLGKGFRIEYDVPDISSEAVAQIELCIVNCEARVVNPRKVSVNFELEGELSCYRQEEFALETKIPENGALGLHARYESAELSLNNAVCEKTIAINEQFSFSGGKPCPSRLVSQSIDFNVSDCQLVGSKVIVKGNANISVCYLSEEVNYPVKTEFSTPFSQIIDIAQDNMDNCSLNIQLTSSYYDIISTINNDKALDAEIHAVIQLISRCKESISYIADAYSNAMPAKVSMQSCRYNMISQLNKLKLSTDERINIVEDCADMLAAFVSISNVNADGSRLSASLSLDIVYRDISGLLSSVRRSINLETEAVPGLRIDSKRISEMYLRPDGQYVDAHFAVELNCLQCSNLEIKKLGALELDEEEAFDLSKYPTVCLVRVEHEKLWDLAKTYHSSPEAICAINEMEENIAGALLLIPKTL